MIVHQETREKFVSGTLMMKKIKLTLLLFISLLSGVSDAQIRVAQGYEIKDSGYAGRLHLQDIYWIDNEQILFLGWKPGDQMVLKDGRTVPKDGLYVWNVKTGAVQVVDERLSALRSVCFQSAFTMENPPKGGAAIERGYVRYVFDVGDTPYVRFGGLFRSRERELDIQAIQDGILEVSPLSCKEFNPKQLRKRYGESPLPLLEAGEYLDRTNQDPFRSPQPLRYFQADGDEPIVLKKIPPIAVIATPRFSEYLQKYVFRELRTNMGADSPMRMWTLDRKGAVEESVIPAGRMMSGSPNAMPSRMGWFVTSNAIASRSAGDAGGYLVSGQKIIRVIAGVPESFAISPDGCKAAISISANWTGEDSASKIKMIELCSKEN